MRTPPAVQIRQTAAASPEARALFAALDADISARYPGAPVHGLQEHEYHSPSIHCFVGWLHNQPVASGVLRVLDATTGEVKRMYVAPALRGQGISRAMLHALEDHARALQLRTVVLETGVKQPEAIGLYESAGYLPMERYGEFIECVDSVCYRKML
ncbi:MAG: GNAT family N-acetyltransferase [Phycisphaerales bacterium]